jgi:hypothetical protein
LVDCWYILSMPSHNLLFVPIPVALFRFIDGMAILRFFWCFDNKICCLHCKYIKESPVATFHPVWPEPVGCASSCTRTAGPVIVHVSASRGTLDRRCPSTT